MPKGTHACIFDQHQSNVMRYDEESCANTWNLHAIKAFEISFLDLSSHLRFWKAKLWTTPHMWNPPLRRIPWRKDAMTWWMHVMCLEINLWGSDFPAVQKTTPILVLKWEMQLRGQNIHSLWTNASFPGKRLAQLLVKAFVLYLYLRNVVLHLVLSWRRFFFSHRLQCYRFAVFETP